MAGRSRTLSIEIVGDTRGLVGAFGEAERKAGGFGTAVGRIGRTAGLAVAGIGVAGIGAAAILGPKVLEMGGQLEALGVKAQTVFGGSIGDVESWASKNAKSMGLTEQQLVGAAAGFGDLMKPMGFTADQAAKMSTEALGLAGALSAWSGGTKSTAEVSDILAGAMLGETDALKGLGIAISAADVEARLAAKGQDTLTGAALEQARALATQELIFEKSTDAQKAWSDGSMDGIKAQNEMKASIGTLQEKLVQALYPAMQQIVPVITDVADWMGNKLPVAMAVVKAWVDANWPAIREAILIAVEQVRAGIEGFVTFVTDAWRQWGDEILAVVQVVWPYIRSTIENVITTVRGIIKTVTSLIKGDWSAVWDGVKQIFSGVWNQMLNFVSTALDLLKTALSLAWSGIKTAVSIAWDGVKSTVTSAIAAIVEYVRGIPSKLASYAAYAFTGISTAMTKAKDWVRDRIDDIVDFATGLPGRMIGLFSGMWDGIKDAFKSAINWVIDKWNGLKFTTPKVSFMGASIGGQTIGVPPIPRLHDGGVVGGQSFAGLNNDEFLAVLQSGEVVMTASQAAATSAALSGGRHYTINVHVPPFGASVDVGREVVIAIQDFERRNGPGWRTPTGGFI
jgi:hypothetical protein